MGQRTNLYTYACTLHAVHPDNTIDMTIDLGFGKSEKLMGTRLYGVKIKDATEAKEAMQLLMSDEELFCRTTKIVNGEYEVLISRRGLNFNKWLIAAGHAEPKDFF